MPDFSLNKEVQQIAGRLDFITNRSSEKLYRDMRETLGYTGNKDPMKRDGSTIKVRITLRNAATHNLDVLIAGQSIGELVYESRKEGNKLQMYECKVVQDTNSWKLEEIALRELGSKRRKLGLDTRYLRAISMIRTKITASWTRSGKKVYVLKKKLSNPKLVQLGDKPFTVRYKRAGVKNLKR